MSRGNPYRHGCDPALADRANQQAFESFPDLAAQVERMAATGQTGSGLEWQAFTDALNAALSADRLEAQDKRIAELEAAQKELLDAALGIAKWVEQRPTQHPYDAWKALNAAIVTSRKALGIS